ncbi:MAG: DUF2092 domain-containing protein [Desulfobaccales bacterium]
MRTMISWGWCILAVFLLVAPVVGFGQEKAPPLAAAPAPQATTAPAPTVPAAEEAIPDPKEIFRQSCDFLKNQPQFSFKAEVANDRVYAGGKKLQFGMEVKAAFRRPDKLRIDGDGDLDSKLLIFDGKALTLYDKDRNHYASIDVAGDIDAALDKAYNDYGLKVGLAELGSTQLGNRAHKDLVNALYVGLHKVRGVPCHHLAFDRKDIHYQVWIEAGDKPVLRKVVITQKKLPDSPQWTAYLFDWNLAPSLGDDLFAFTPPAGAQKIKFMPVKKTETPASKKGKAKEKGDQS